MKELLFRLKNLPFPYLYYNEKDELEVWSVVAAAILADSFLIVSIMIYIHRIFS